MEGEEELIIKISGISGAMSADMDELVACVFFWNLDGAPLGRALRGTEEMNETRWARTDAAITCSFPDTEFFLSIPLDAFSSHRGFRRLTLHPVKVVRVARRLHWGRGAGPGRSGRDEPAVV